MKHVSRKFTVFLLVLAIAVSLFCVTSYAAGEDAVGILEDLSVDSLIDSVKTEFSEAPYIGEYCETAFEALGDISEYYFIIFGVLALIACFFGYRLLRFALVLAGLFGGFFGGLVLFPYVEKLVSGLPDFVELILAGVCALAGALLLHFLFRVAIFVGVGYVTFTAAAPYFAEMQNGMLYRILVAIGVAVIAVLLLKLVFVLGSAVVGGTMAALCFCSKVDFLTKPIYENDAVFSHLEPFGIEALSIALIIGVVVGLLGVIFQFANTRRRRA